MDAESLVEAFLEYLRARRCSASLLERSRAVLPRLLSHLESQSVEELCAVTEAHLVSFMRELATSHTRYGRSPSLATQRAYLALAGRFFAFLEARGTILHNPAKGLSLPSQHALPRSVLSPSQAQRLLEPRSLDNPRWWAEAVETRDRAIVELFYGTALRLGECLRLELGDLDLFEGRLWVRNGKGRKDRVVPVVGQAARILDDYLRTARPLLTKDPHEPALFVEYQRGGRLSRSGLVAMLRCRVRAVGLVARVTPHVLRHSCATHLLKGGANVRHVQELLGHSQIETTAIYTRVDTSDLAKVIERSHPRGGRLRRRKAR